LPSTPPAQRAGSGILVLMFLVFFILGGVTNINDVLIPKFKGLFDLTNFQANLVQFAFFTSYALFSIPAGLLMRRIGYLRGIVGGFLVIGMAALLFLPAAYTGSYPPFLAALFVLGGGITLLQVAMNPVILSLGDPRTAHSRLTFAQLFNSIGVFLMIYGGAELLLGTSAADVDVAALSAAELQDYRTAEATLIGHAYLGLAAAMVFFALLFWLGRAALDRQAVETARGRGFVSLLRASPRLRFGALCIFCYVGAEVAIGSNLIEYLGQSRVMGLDKLEAGRLLALYWGGALAGRLVGGFILRAFAPGRVLAAFAVTAIVLIAVSALTTGPVAGWTLILVGLFNSIMFPTIFSLGVEGLAEDTAQASGIMCTAIVGGALVPPLLGMVADVAGFAAALAVPALCYAIIAGFGLRTAAEPPASSGFA
jgi:FHS family L-fucose permease-like MFS transporter